MVTYDAVSADPEIRTYVTAGNDALGVLGFTEHGFAHAVRTSEVAAYILEGIGVPKRETELAKIAAFLHDCGNMINRHDHAMFSALIAFRCLEKLGMEPVEIASVVAAIGNHDEGTGQAVSRITAALIIADKSDVRRSRVRNTSAQQLVSDIHDRVNYACRESKIVLSDDRSFIMLELDIDTKVCPVIDYFEIFLTRMLMCRRAAEFLGLSFGLNINGTRLL